MKFFTKNWANACEEMQYGEMGEQKRARIQGIEASARLAKRCEDMAAKSLRKTVDFDKYIEQNLLRGELSDGTLTVEFTNGTLTAKKAIARTQEIEWADLTTQKSVLKAVELENLGKGVYALRMLFARNTETGTYYYENAVDCANVRFA